MNLVLSWPKYYLSITKKIKCKMSKKVFISTFPFGKCGKKPIELLQKEGIEIVNNPLKRRLKKKEVVELIHDVDVIIAGTEPYPEEIYKLPRLEAICRVGIGLDNIMFKEAIDNNIKITYTPDAPSQAVAELTVANIICLARKIIESDRSVRMGYWNRYLGHLLKELTIGVLGVGRIGKILIKLLQPFGVTIIASDIHPDEKFKSSYNFDWASTEDIFRKSDIITLHIPGNKANYNFVSRDKISLMKTGSSLINSSRGTVIDEEALYDALIQGHIGGAALDVFKDEPYSGKLTKLDNVIFTAHMGASANESRYLMELGAVEDCIRILKGEQPKHDAILENPDLIA